MNMSLTHLYTMIANRTVRTPRRSVELACDAPFHSHCDTIYLHAAIQGRSEIVLSVLVRWSWKEDINHNYLSDDS